MIHPIDPAPNGSSSENETVAELSIELRHRLLNRKGRVAIAAYFTGGAPAEDGEPEEEAIAVAAGDIFSDSGRNRIHRSLCESLTSDLIRLGIDSEYAFWSDLEKIARLVWEATVNGEAEKA